VNAAGQLRNYKLVTGAMSASLRYGKRHYGECGYFNKEISFREPILSDIELIHSLKSLIKTIYHQGFGYTQGGVVLEKLSEAVHRQRGLFDQEGLEHREKLEKFAHAVDTVNYSIGNRIVYPASLCVKDKKWRPNKQFLSETSSAEIRTIFPAMV
jgi:DNA polymerase V